EKRNLRSNSKILGEGRARGFCCELPYPRQEADAWPEEAGRVPPIPIARLLASGEDNPDTTHTRQPPKECRECRRNKRKRASRSGRESGQPGGAKVRRRVA